LVIAQIYFYVYTNFGAFISVVIRIVSLLLVRPESLDPSNFNNLIQFITKFMNFSLKQITPNDI